MIGSFFDLGLVDKVVAFVAPKVIGGRDALGPVEGRGAADLKSATSLESWSWKQVGNDLMLEGYVSTRSARAPELEAGTSLPGRV